ncbi:CRISPR-associated RAMP protein Csx7 [Caloramator sp. CAR-1]|uniref:type III CRISPR-associated RAMP protein Csx7 n=1 Tax=Caloramator sp. CAR-1 TaxID=3062777 RepID=UPI0026E18F26|nr:CRISPR-associated RAMP protein Csx7 [Caloramator sp. CAR-1]MDO6354866.1 CRISPR-associated RAMP protein Csx7 [Caloramator sp. CAR-1]
MFKKIYNEAIITYTLKTKSPLFIRSGKEEGLDPTKEDNTFITVHKDGQVIPFMPGTSIKGVFRSRAEKLLPNSCNLFSGACLNQSDMKNKNGTERYKLSCPACKMFGSTALKSRVLFSDAYPVGKYFIGSRTSVAIERISGAAKQGALFNMEYVEDAEFKGEIRLQNFFKWHIKTLVEVFKDINNGFVTFGGLTSKGFGRMEVKEFNIKLRYYNKGLSNNNYADKGFYIEREINSLDELDGLLRNIQLNDNELRKGDLNEQAI